ncbi:cytochrome c oxidase subunit II [Calidithermus chliarophilus]|uniref:cytochrome c oxidase subunit II n=1 Tax=Calidithermus chliarophilus TaxID=52023 RepID=UPI000427E899|nr:cytochrome c oxidase subunit II [Calidithermus chliarophilus]
MNESHHAFERYEAIWLRVVLVMILVFLVLIAYTALNYGQTIPRGAGQIRVGEVRAGSEFANPRLEQVGNEYVAYVQAFAFGYSPGEMRVKRGRKVTFYVASPDVVHGFMIERTNINVEVVPGYVSKVEYTFDRPGTYKIICHQYCGLGHAKMLSRIVVEE